MVDRDNLPRPAPEVTEDGVPAIDEIPEGVLLTGDLLQPGAEDGLGDDRPDSVGEADFGLEDTTLSAEESAMRVVEEPPGLNYDPDPGYVDRELGG